jgi:hypothetical protein
VLWLVFAVPAIVGAIPRGRFAAFAFLTLSKEPEGFQNAG